MSTIASPPSCAPPSFPTEIVFLDRGSLPVPVRMPGFTHRWIEYENTTPEDLPARVARAQVVITNKVPLSGALLRTLPQLRLIAVAATGVNIIDCPTARAQGIAVCHVRDYARTTLPEHVLMLMLALMRALPAYQQAMRTEAWETSPHFCHFGSAIRDLSGATLVLVGSGSLGKGVAQRAAALGMLVVRAERKGAALVRPGYVPFHEALMQADVLSLHCPLTGETQQLIGAAELGLMKTSAVLINTARGGLLDESALLAALQSRRLAGAGLDVLVEEPPRPEHRLLAALRDDPTLNLIITPHIAWASQQALHALAEQLIDNIEAWANGSARNLVCV